MDNLRGVFAVLATPFNADGAIDFAGFAANLEHYVQKKVSGVMIAGALGEYLTMTFAERKKLVEFGAQQLAGRIPFMVGAIAHRPADVIDLAGHAAVNGAQGIMVLPPPGAGLLRDEIYAFYKRVAENVTLPILLYNNPGSSGMDLEFELVRELADLPNVAGIKESSGDIKRITRIREELAGRLTPFCGWEDMHLESFLAGAGGWICMGANFAPGLTRDLFELAAEGELQKARNLSAGYNPLARHLETAGKVTQTTKYIMDKVGLCGGHSRLPRQPLTSGEKTAVNRLLENIELY